MRGRDAGRYRERGERGAWHVMRCLDRIGVGLYNMASDHTGMCGGIRRESVAVIVRFVTSDKRAASIVAGNAVSTRERERVNGMRERGSCELRAWLA